MSKMRIALCLAFMVSSAFAASARLNSLSGEFIDQINSKQNSWKAGRNFDPNTPSHEIKKLMGAMIIDPSLQGIKPTVHSDDIEIPETFDARSNWPVCKDIIGTIADQSSCGSCWAVSTSSAMSDRRCIASNGKLTIPVSAEDLMACCSECGTGCNGGTPSYTWKYWISQGIVTGGAFNSSLGCKPYPFQSCDHYVEGKHVPCTELHYKSPECSKTCTGNLDYKSEKTFGEGEVKWLNTVEDAQKEILKYGPVSATLGVFDDMLNYKSGVYQYTDGYMVGLHAVRVIGWGVENGTPYWLIANSWNEDWGDKGLFKIKRGNDEVGVESNMFGANPKL